MIDKMFQNENTLKSEKYENEIKNEHFEKRIVHKTLKINW
jgi:hypothetical protein